jgi:Protein of unknown function (DUF3048) N-terminal domain/Protein of unknown function (DUF3048) C-terminal domain
MKKSLLLLLALAIAGCGTPQPTLPPLPTQPPAGSTPDAATQPASTESVAPVDTATPLAATATLAPTATTASDAVPCPLTGMPVSQATLAARRPILVQIGNSSPERPQFGLMQADMVFETIAEGGITRFSAIFLCQDAAEIAGVRSGRLVDLQLLPMFDAIFVHVGASEQVQKKFEDDKHIRDTSLDFYRAAPGFTQQPDRRRAPFDVFTSTAALYDAAKQVNISLPSTQPVPQLTFADAVPAGGSPAATVTIKHHSSYWVRWKWNASEGVWERYLTNDTAPNTEFPHVDAATGRPLSAKNVLIIQAVHEQTDIIEDSLQSHSVQVDLIGSGPATLFRDGQMFTGTWARANPTDFFTFTQADGSAMPLHPGNTFVHLYPTTFKFDVTQ